MIKHFYDSINRLYKSWFCRYLVVWDLNGSQLEGLNSWRGYMWRSVQKVINEKCSLSHVVYLVIDELTTLVIVSHLIWFRLLEGYGEGTSIIDVDIVVPMAYNKDYVALNIKFRGP